MKAALIGHPVAHSKSPLIHEYWMKQQGIKGSYELIDVEMVDLADQVQRFIDGGYNGFNITVPHKENILLFCDVLDDNAKQIGAVNTVHIKEGRLHGYNTDCAGFIDNLKNTIIGFSGKGKTALVLGAGGAARAVIQGLKNEGFEKIYLSNRTIEKSEKLKNDFGDLISVIDWEEREVHGDKVDLLVNTTSLGMVNKPPLEFDLTAFNDSAVIYDIVYNPLMTKLLKEGENKGLKVVTGIGMLLYQAAPAFELWTSLKPQVTKELEDIVLS